MNPGSHALHTRLEAFYCRYNHREFVHPDPLEFLYRYDRLEDREIVGFVASSLAYGRVAQILVSVERIVAVMGPNPQRMLHDVSRSRLRRALCGFVHRFADAASMEALLWAIRCVLKRYGSLNRCFQEGYDASAPTVLPALGRFTAQLKACGSERAGHLVPDPEKGSAAKRLHLFLRWMVRQDRVDPGGWDFVSQGQLLVPLDVHMKRVAARLGLTRRKAADLKTVLEVTNGFRAVVPTDPVRYDFVLSRLGIRDDLDIETFFDPLDRQT